MTAPAANLIDTAVNIELECAALYEAYARCFAGREDVVYFWRLYAEAERYHAATIRIHQASFQDAGAVDAEVSDAEAREFLDRVRQHRAEAERSRPTVTDALRVARWVEEHSADLHARSQFFRSRPELAELFDRMAEEDRTHRDVLKSAEEKFGA